MSKTVKLGVVGLGRGRAVVTEAIGEDNVTLTAICDHNPQKLKDAIEYFKGLGVDNLQTYGNYDDLLKSDIDAVFIATDAIYHVPFVVKALDAGKHVMSEIPTVNSLEEAKTLKAAVKAHPELKYMAGENVCYASFIQQWKKMYDDGKFGETIYAESEYMHSKDYRDYKESDYPQGHWRTFNPAIKYLTHNLGPLLYIMNDRCVSVSCMAPDIIYNPYKKDGYVQNGVALFKTAKGAVIRILICFGAYVHFDHNFRIIGTRGSIETDSTKSLEDAHSFASFSDIPRSLEEKIELPYLWNYPDYKGEGHGGCDKMMLKAFIKCIVDDTEPPIDVDMGIQMSLPGIIAHESFEQGGAALEIPEIL